MKTKDLIEALKRCDPELDAMIITKRSPIPLLIDDLVLEASEFIPKFNAIAVKGFYS